MKEKPAHYGYNIKRLREILGMKQIVIAEMLEVTQQAVSKIEKQAYLEDSILEKFAKIFNVTAKKIKDFEEESIANFLMKK